MNTFLTALVGLVLAGATATGIAVAAADDTPRKPETSSTVVPYGDRQ